MFYNREHMTIYVNSYKNRYLASRSEVCYPI